MDRSLSYLLTALSLCLKSESMCCGMPFSRHDVQNFRGTPGPNRQTLPHGRCAARPPAHPPTRMNTHGPAHTNSTLFQRWCQRSHTVSVSIVIERRTHSRGQREHGARETSRDAPCTLQITPTNESPDDSAGWSCAHAAARRRWPFGRLCEVGEAPGWSRWWFRFGRLVQVCSFLRQKGSVSATSSRPPDKPHRLDRGLLCKPGLR